MSAFMQYEGYTGTCPRDALVVFDQRDPNASLSEPNIENRAAPATQDIEPVIRLRNAQKSAYRDLLMAAAMGVSTATIAATIGLMTLWSASSFVFGSFVAYSIAAHRIFAMTQFVKI